MRRDDARDVTWCGCGHAAPGRVRLHPCRVLCVRVPAHLAEHLGVPVEDVVAAAEELGPGRYEAGAEACSPDPARCRVCGGRGDGRLTVSGVDAVVEMITVQEEER